MMSNIMSRQDTLNVLVRGTPISAAMRDMQDSRPCQQAAANATNLFDFARRSSHVRVTPLSMRAHIMSNVREAESVPQPGYLQSRDATVPSADGGPEVSNLPAPQPLITLIKGRFFVPSSAPKQRSAPSRALREAMHNCAYGIAREPLAIPAGINQIKSRPGITHLDEEPLDPPTTSAAQRDRACANEVERVLSIFTADMAQHLLPLSQSEQTQIIAAATTNIDDFIASRLRSYLKDKAARHLASLQNARRALLALFDFARGVGITLTDFKASTGLISAFLSSQMARTMASSRLRGLIWAQHNLGIELNADAAALKSYSENRSSGANHALTMPVKIACHLAVIASDKAQPEYTRALAAGIHLLAAASLRWADAQRCTWKVLSGTLEGKGETKTGFAYWWGEKPDLLGGTDWYRPLAKSYKGLKHAHDYVFRRATFKRGFTGDLDHFSKWEEGPARKEHVVTGYIQLLQMEPLSLSLDEAKRYARLHGGRRLYPTLGRFMSHQLNLSTDDRQELGRWAPASGGAPGGAPMTNLYASDAQRTRCVSTRKRVADAARDLIKGVGWQNIPLDGGGFEAFISGEVDIAQPEPDLSDDESDVEIA